MRELHRIEDALERHLSMRASLVIDRAPPRVTEALARYDRVPLDATDTALDALVEYTETLDFDAHPEQPARNQRTRAALDRTLFSSLISAVDRGDPSGVARWMGALLGLSHPAPLRVTDAFARGGAHRYSMADGALSQRWRDSLVVRDEHPLLRGARLYFDAIFLHPFDDGNARLARALLVAAAHDRASFDVGPAVWLPKRAGHEEDLWRFVTVCAHGALARERRRYHRAH